MFDLKHAIKKQQTCGASVNKSTGNTVAHIALLSIILSFPAMADYVPVIENPADGYYIRFTGQTTLAAQPIISGAGHELYKIGSTLSLGMGSPNLTISGRSKCLGKVYQNVTNIKDEYAYHRIATVTSPDDMVNDESIFKVTDNLYAGIPYQVSSNWLKATESVCAGTSSSPPSSISVPATSFTKILPIKVSLYLRKRIIDNQIHVPQTDLGGYVLYFSQDGRGPRNQAGNQKVPISQTTIPLRLAPFTITIPSSCKVTTSSGTEGQLNISHGRLNSMNYDSEAQGKITYTCQFASQTKINLKLDYISDTDPQKRLPLTSTTDNQKKIYSELTMVDDNTGQSGKAFPVVFKENQSITIKSHLKGSNADGGHYQGSAWVIATFE